MDNSYIKTEWTLLSFCGALIGIYFASHYFPSAIPGQIKTGYFDVDVASPLLFALGTGIFFGMAQWAALRHILGNANVHAKEAQELWAPVTTIGVVAMMLPLLWIDAVAPARLYIAGLPCHGARHHFIVYAATGTCSQDATETVLVLAHSDGRGVRSCLGAACFLALAAHLLRSWRDILCRNNRALHWSVSVRIYRRAVIIPERRVQHAAGGITFVRMAGTTTTAAATAMNAEQPVRPSCLTLLRDLNDLTWVPRPQGPEWAQVTEPRGAARQPVKTFVHRS